MAASRLCWAAFHSGSGATATAAAAELAAAAAAAAAIAIPLKGPTEGNTSGGQFGQARRLLVVPRQTAGQGRFTRTQSANQSGK